MTSYCNKCKKLTHIVKYKRGDPILSCGHIKAYSEKAAKCRDDMNSLISVISKTLNKTTDEVRSSLLDDIVCYLYRDTTLDYCPVCQRDVTVVIDRFGRRFCRGDMLSTPGCGFILKPHVVA